MQIIRTTADSITLDVHANAIDARNCTVGEAVAISAEPAISRLALEDQPGGCVATFSTTEVTCFEPGSHRFAIWFADGTVGGLRLIAHERA